MAITSTVPAATVQIRQTPGRNRRSRRQTTKRTRFIDPNGFLKIKFEPLYLAPEQGPDKTVAQFTGSLERVCAERGIAVPQIPDVSYPQNISEQFRQLNAVIDRFGKSCIIVQDEQHQTSIGVFNEYNTPYFLNYIPFRPICNIINAECHKALKPLVIEISRYLCTQVEFMKFLPGSYAWEVYTRMRDWSTEYDVELETEEERKNNSDQIEAIDMMQLFAERNFPQINKPHSLARLKNAVKKWKTTPGHCEKWTAVAEGFLNLASQYPKHNLRTNIAPEFYKNLEEDDLIELEQWACFIWSFNDILFDRFDEYMQVELQEKTTKESPVHLRLFSTTGASAPANFDFETRLFDLLNQFVSLLIDYDHDEL
jgi:hypothetical protein